MAVFRRSVNKRSDKTADELAMLRTELGRDLCAGLAELRSLNAELRQQIGTSLESGLQDLRDDLRELRRELNDAHKTITETRRESESLRLELETARRQAAEARTETLDRTTDNPLPPVSAPDLEPAPTTVATRPPVSREAPPPPLAPGPDRESPEPSEQQKLDNVLEQAAGISAADLICHRDAWAFIVEQAARNAHFRVPGLATNGVDAEQTNVTLSGRTMIAILSSLHATQHSPATSREDRALAATYFSRIAGVINNVLPSQSDATRTRVVIDDRPLLAIDNAAN